MHAPADKPAALGWRRLAPSMVLIALMMSGNGLVAPILSLYALQFGVSGALVGMMITLFGIGRLLSNMPAGVLSRRYGTRLFICLGPAILFVGGVGAALASDFTLLLFWRFVQGIGSGIYMTISGTVLLQLSRPGERGRVMAAYQGSLLLGAGIGPAIGGFLAEHFGFAAPFWALASVAGAAFLFALYAFEEPPAVSNLHSDGKPKPPLPVRMLFRHAPYLLLCVITFGVFFTRTAALWVLLPLVGQQTFGLSVDIIGAALSVSALANFLMLPVVGPSIDRLGSRPITIFSTLLTGLALAMIGLSSSIAVFWVAIVILGIGNSFGGPSVGAAMADAVPQELYGPAMGLQRMVGDTAFVAGPIVAGLFSDIAFIGNQGGLVANALLMIGAGAIFAIGSRPRRAI